MAKGLFGGGDGSESNPFLVEDANDLLAISTKNFEDFQYCYKQTANIDMQGIDFKTIGDLANGPPFGGVYDGDRNGILNLSVSSDNPNSYVGLFGLVTGTIKNVFIKKASINGIGGHMGILLGGGNSFNLENCTIEDSNILGSSNYVGGFFGDSNSGNINKCEIINSTVVGDDRVGVFCAYPNWSTFKNCISDGVATITSTDKSGGTFRIGAFGDTYNRGNTFINSYANVSMQGEDIRVAVDKSLYSIGFQYAFADINSNTVSDCCSNVDNITDSTWREGVNYNENSFAKGSDGSIYNCKEYQPTGSNWTDYWEGLIGSPNHPQARSSPQMLMKSNYENWDFKDTWKWIDGKFPRLHFAKKRALITCKRVPLNNYRR